MKLRKSMAAAATAFACTLTPVAVPMMAPTAVAAIDNNKSYAEEYGDVQTKIEQQETSYNKLTEELNAYKPTSDDGEWQKKEANFQLELAKPSITRAKEKLAKILELSDNDENAAGTVYSEDKAVLLISASSIIDGSNEPLTKAKHALDEARNADIKDQKAKEKAEKEKEEQKVDCSKYEVKSDDDDSSSGSSDFDFFGSSGYEKVYENGKAKCVKKSEIWTDRLAKIVTVLGTMFTLVTTLTKIDGALKQMAPGAPAA